MIGVDPAILGTEDLSVGLWLSVTGLGVALVASRVVKRWSVDAMREELQCWMDGDRRVLSDGASDRLARTVADDWVIGGR